MAAAWASIKIDEAPPPRFCRGIDVLVFLGALGRFVVGEILPFSGHMLFFIHSILTTKNRLFKTFAGLLILETTYIKLKIWHDYQSWGWGTGLGIVSGVAYLIIRKIHGKKAV